MLRGVTDNLKTLHKFRESNSAASSCNFLYKQLAQRTWRQYVRLKSH